MERIKRLWFENDRIWIETTEGNTYSRPLEAFPVLKLATDDQRNRYEIIAKGEFAHWQELDEDIEMESFYDTNEPHYDNEIARIFSANPQLNIKAVASEMGIHFSLLYKYIYGMVTPSEKRLRQLEGALHSIAMKLNNVSALETPAAVAV